MMEVPPKSLATLFALRQLSAVDHGDLILCSTGLVTSSTSGILMGPLHRPEGIPMETPLSRSAVAAGALDPGAAEPLYRQLYERLRQAILRGNLAPGSKIPSTRALADELRIARNTVVTAYEQLFAEGYLEGKL